MSYAEQIAEEFFEAGCEKAVRFFRGFAKVRAACGRRHSACGEENVPQRHRGTEFFGGKPPGYSRRGCADGKTCLRHRVSVTLDPGFASPSSATPGHAHCGAYHDVSRKLPQIALMLDTAWVSSYSFCNRDHISRNQELQVIH